MSRNGSGIYSLPAGNPVVTGTTISSTVHNATMADIATALTASLSADGQTTPSANLPMGGFKHTGVASATTRTDYCTAAQSQDNTFDWLTTIAGVDTITATAAISLAAYAAGQVFRFASAGANTGATTLNINGIGAKAITKNGTTALAAGDIPADAVAEVIYDGTQFQLGGTSLKKGDIGVTVQAYDADIPTVSASQAEMEAGTEAALRSMSPLRVAQAIAELSAPSVPSVDGRTGAVVTLVAGTAVASTSGTEIDFTGVPSWAKRVTVILVGVSTNGTSPVRLQIGGGSVETTGYQSTHTVMGVANGTSTGGFDRYQTAAADVSNGTYVLTLVGSDTWVCVAQYALAAGGNPGWIVGQKTTAAALDRVRLTTVGGTDAFDAGLVNILWE